MQSNNISQDLLRKLFFFFCEKIPFKIEFFEVKDKISKVISAYFNILYH